MRGENVSSFEVEALIASHDKVRAVAAVAVPAKIGEEEDVPVFIELVEGEPRRRTNCAIMPVA